MTKKKSLRDRLAETGPRLANKLAETQPVKVAREVAKDIKDPERLREAGVDLTRSHEKGR